MAKLGATSAVIAGALAAIGASLCCGAPLLLLMLGIGGAWIARLTALSPYSPIFTGLTLVFLGLAFRTLYLAPRLCVAGEACADRRVLGRQRLIFWSVAVPSLGALAAPWLAPLFY